MSQALQEEDNDETASYLRAEENWETLTSELIQRYMSNGGKGRRITINASGMVCTSFEGYLRRFPGTLLSDMVRDPGGELHRKSVHFIDRHPFATSEIVNCYRDGFLPVKPPHIPVEVWQNELLFFRMHKATAKIPGLDGFVRLYRKSESPQDSSEPPKESWRFTLYQVLEIPESSTTAALVSRLSMLLVCFSVATVCLETVKECSKRESCKQMVEVTDLVVVSIFSVEYILRLVATQQKLRFVKNLMNIIDLLSILPTWIAIIFSESSQVPLEHAFNVCSRHAYDSFGSVGARCRRPPARAPHTSNFQARTAQCWPPSSCKNCRVCPKGAWSGCNRNNNRSMYAPAGVERMFGLKLDSHKDTNGFALTGCF
jgi:hypothetical protein